MDPDAWKAFLDVQKASHTLTIPIVLYGPGDTVKLKVLFTWDRFITKTYSRFLNEGQQWWHEGSHMGHGDRETFLTDVRFDPRPKVMLGKDHSRQLVDADKYKTFKGTNVVKLVMKTTPPAVSQARDITDGVSRSDCLCWSSRRRRSCARTRRPARTPAWRLPRLSRR
jgi:hypothetical protein